MKTYSFKQAIYFLLYKSQKICVTRKENEVVPFRYIVDRFATRWAIDIVREEEFNFVDNLYYVTLTRTTPFRTRKGDPL